jgi:hypothetical protein
MTDIALYKRPDLADVLDGISKVDLNFNISRRAFIAGMAGGLAACVVGCDGGKPSVTTALYTTQPTQTTQPPPTTTQQFDSVFQGYLDKMSADPSLSNTLISLYKTEPEAARNIGYLYVKRPTLADLLITLDWFKDGLNESKLAFINYCLGSYEQGLTSSFIQDDFIKDIMVNERYAVDDVQLSGGNKNIVIASNADNSLYKNDINVTMQLAKVSAPQIEIEYGAKYPFGGITIILNYGNFGHSSAGNGIMNFGLSTSSGVQNQGGIAVVFTHELSHIFGKSRKVAGVAQKEWVGEGLAELVGALVAEKMSQGGYSWWNYYWNINFDDYYNSWMKLEQNSVWWGTPLSSQKMASSGGVGQATHDDLIGMGFIFLKNLRDLMGVDASTKMMTGIYDWQTDNPNITLDENILQEYAFGSCNGYAMNNPAVLMKDAVQKLFDSRVWGK